MHGTDAGKLHANRLSTRNRSIYYEGSGHELYDLEADPEELDNLADLPEQQERVHAMRTRLLDWLITADENDQIAPRRLL